MLGPEGASVAVSRLLEAHLPAKIVEVLARVEALRLPRIDRELMAPKLIESHDVLSMPVDSFPAFLVVAQDTAVGLTRIDVADDVAHAGQAVYAVRYRLRVFVWARGRVGDPDPALRGKAADLARKRLTLATREVLLDHLAVTVELGADGAGAGGTTVRGRIDPATMAESYSDVARDDRSTLAGSWIEFELTLEESAPAGTPGIPVVAVAPSVAPIPHPAL